MAELSQEFTSGGLGWNGNTSPFTSVTDTLGRAWNNLNGTTAVNRFNADEAEKARLFNSAEAQKNRDWQTFMSNTAYSRAAEDMKRAGINPASLGGDAAGSAASTPGGSTANGVAAHGSSGGTGGFLGALLSGVQMALREKIARTAISAKEGIADENRRSREAIAAANRESKEGIASKDRSSKEGIADRKLASEEGRFGDSLELKGMIASQNLLHKQDVQSALAADRLAKNALRQQELDDKRIYNLYHGENEKLTYWERYFSGKHRKG